jgi:hypothetical protein
MIKLAVVLSAVYQMSLMGAFDAEFFKSIELVSKHHSDHPRRLQASNETTTTTAAPGTTTAGGSSSNETTTTTAAAGNETTTTMAAGNETTTVASGNETTTVASGNETTTMAPEAVPATSVNLTEYFNATDFAIGNTWSNVSDPTCTGPCCQCVASTMTDLLTNASMGLNATCNDNNPNNGTVEICNFLVTQQNISTGMVIGFDNLVPISNSYCVGNGSCPTPVVTSPYELCPDLVNQQLNSSSDALVAYNIFSGGAYIRGTGTSYLSCLLNTAYTIMDRATSIEDEYCNSVLGTSNTTTETTTTAAPGNETTTTTMASSETTTTGATGNTTGNSTGLFSFFRRLQASNETTTTMAPGGNETTTAAAGGNETTTTSSSSSGTTGASTCQYSVSQCQWRQNNPDLAWGTKYAQVQPLKYARGFCAGLLLDF